MRHWFLVLLIALLPLRSGLGDAMAAGLLCPPPATAHVMAADAAMDDSAHAQHGVAHTMDAPAAHAESSPCPDGSLCSACQICHSTAIAPTAAPPLLAPQVRTAPPPALGDFASAERALALKPPIG